MTNRLVSAVALTLGLVACNEIVAPEPLSDPPAQAAVVTTTMLNAVDLGTLGGPTSIATGINDEGQVAGYSRFGPSYYNHVFLWERGVMTDIGTLNSGHSAQADAINNAGQVVGFSYGAPGGRYHAVLWEDGVGWTDLGTLNGGFSFAKDVNELGEVVGANEGIAFRWTQASGMEALGSWNTEAYGMNDLGQVVGRKSAGVPGRLYHGFLWTEAGGMVDLNPLGGGIEAYAEDVNNHGVVVGWSTDWQGRRRPVRWSGSIAGDLGTLGGPTGHAYAVNDAGQIVGVSSTANGEVHATMWGPGGVVTDLGKPPGARSSLAYDINERGQAVGYSYVASGEIHAVLWTDNLPPVADAGTDQTVARSSPDGVSVTLDGSGSSDADGSITRYEWLLEGSVVAEGPTADAVLGLGVYPITLRVTDDLGGVGQDDVVIEVVNSAPVAEAGGDVRVLVTRTATFDGSGSQDIDGLLASYEWDFGDGAVGAGVITTHAYAPPGQYVATLTVTDNDGASSSDAAAVTVLTPSEAMDDLIGAVTDLVASGTLSEQDANGPLAKLTEAKRHVDAGRAAPASGKLHDFIDQVNALVNAGRLSPAQAQPLIDPAQDVIDVITA